MRFLIILFVWVGFFQSCADKFEVNNILSCREKVLKENGMIPYTGVETYCESIWAYEYEDKEYYCLDRCNVDKVCSLFDCNNVHIFTIDGTENGEFDMVKYKLISDKKKLIGIVGIRR